MHRGSLGTQACFPDRSATRGPLGRRASQSCAAEHKQKGTNYRQCNVRILERFSKA